MQLTSELTDQAILEETGARLARLRVEKNLSQAALAEASGVSKRTIERLERGEAATQLSGFIRVCRALGLIERLEALLPEAPASPVEQAKLLGRRRQRASSRRGHGADKPGEWTWGKR
jgi:transcriptional regulator with XRE-family HTH domain